MSGSDGPGLRTVFFLQGCNFRCLYCHNPDTWALEAGSLISEAKILDILKNAQPYFGDTGGVTFSGGEVLLQAHSLLPIIKSIQSKLHLSVAVDTNGSLLTPAAQAVLKQADLVIFDLKHIDSASHCQLTGQNNAAVKAALAYRDKLQRPFWLRYVLVPGYTDDYADLKSWGKYIKRFTMLKRVEILPYHTWGIYKYQQLNLPYPLINVPPATPNDIARAQKLINFLGHST
jgi:pyruvate formate lyase activating enzyme